jgi:hypothetical protein
LLSLCVRGFSASDAQGLVASAHLGNLMSLSLPQARMSATGMAILTGSSVLHQLSELALSANSVGDAGVLDLVSSLGSSRLEKLGLASNNIRDKGVAALASADLSMLKSLDLSHNRFGGFGAQALASSPALAGLRALRVPMWGLGEPGRTLLKSRFDDRVQFV